MGSPFAVDELEVHPQRLLVARQPHREFLLHLVEEESLIPLVPDGDPHLLAGKRRDEHLGLEAGGRDLGGFDHLGGEDPVLYEKHVGVEPGPLVPGNHLANHPEHSNHLTGWEHPLEGHDVVELDVLPLLDSDPELEWGGVFGPEDPADHVFHPRRE